ncbi:DUF4942 domain-containing protein [Methylomonas rosea]|uniref:DUF4942 domain-containing protein n=1 Tax=Methylomonas rosea TaxID=2952227 RepID=A0ABT1TUT0_9GAMM|nr:DUF4942 domain-containing protein [Methylomonas sp. WSC-7]MCQ8118514.1 DUF4942 domain-containing protein [Methylomonas sp. WSC-7]
MMNTLQLKPTHSIAIDEDGDFFAPVSADAIDCLLAKYNADLTNIRLVEDFMNGGAGGVVHYFAEGSKNHSGSSHHYYSTTFRADWAVEALKSAYWSRAIAMTDVMDYMPQKRRDEWRASIDKPMGVKKHLSAYDRSMRIQNGEPTDIDEWEIQPIPDFTEDTVRATLTQLLLSREKFFAERVDGIFRALSGVHITNSPVGFGKRMILNRVYTVHGKGFYSQNSSMAGYINDLRSVIAKFMGRDEPAWYITSRTIDNIPKDGQWNVLDGGAIRIRLYMVGTAHLEIHPDMAWRLNAVLASLYPAAIPAQFRTKPERKAKDIALLQHPLPFAVLSILAESKPRHNEKRVQLPFGSQSTNKFAWEEASRVLQSIGGVDRRLGNYEFNYCPANVINEIVMSGCIPDHRSHQYYPTNGDLAQRAVEEAEIQPTDQCAETSAGQGGIAAFMPTDRTTCIEISPLHCEILRSKGFNTIEADFLEWAKYQPAQVFDKIVINPPFSDGRAVAHVITSMQLIKPSGRLVAILPSSYINKAFDVAGEWSFTWSSPIENAFSGTSISVAILRADRLS